MRTQATALLALAMLSCTAATAAEPVAIGSKVANFTLKDFHGQPVSLDNADGKVVVLAFLGTECPLAKTYASRLTEMAKTYGPQGSRLPRHRLEPPGRGHRDRRLRAGSMKSNSRFSRI